MLNNHACPKCPGNMLPGQALENILTGSPDFIGGEIVTISPSGMAKIVDCLKCERCGYSVTKGNKNGNQSQ